jgi:hypothetical protein
VELFRFIDEGEMTAAFHTYHLRQWNMRKKLKLIWIDNLITGAVYH